MTAIQNGLHCLVLTDHLAQSFYNHEGKNGGDPIWHEAAVRQGIDEATATKITFTTKSDFLNDPEKFVSTLGPPDIRTVAKAVSPKLAMTAAL
jgi:hypothetical protein